LQIKTKIVSYHTADSKPVKQEVNSTAILASLVFPDESDVEILSITLESPITLLQGAIYAPKGIIYGVYSTRDTYNKTAGIRHQCRKTTVLRCHRCLINTDVEKTKKIKYRIQL
jgi:hypothetical protein